MAVLLILAALWAAFLIPQVLQARAERQPVGSISDFRRQLHVLGRTTPSGVAAGPGRRAAGPVRPAGISHGAGVRPMVPGRRRSTAAKRRRDIFLGLLVAMGASLLLGLLPSLRVLLAVHVVLDLLFVAYVAALISLRNAAAERDMKVRFLPTPAPARTGEPALLLRRSAN